MAVKKLVGAMALLLVAPPAFAGDGVRLSYDIYLGGLHIMDGRIDMARDDGAYAGVLDLENRGFSAMFVDWKMSAKSSGLAPDDGAALRPLAYKMHREWGDRWRIREFDWTAEGDLVRQRSAKARSDKLELELKPEELKGSIDTVTAFAQMMQQVTATASCKTVLPLYDGKRRFDITMSDGEMVKLSLTGYKGEARACTSRMKPVAGFDKGEGGGIWGDLSDPEAEALPMWMAQPKGSPFMVPVKFQMQSERGLISAVLQSARPLSADQAKDLIANAPKPVAVQAGEAAK